MNIFNVFNKYIDSLASVKQGKEIAALAKAADKDYKVCKKAINDRIKEYQKVAASINIDFAKEKTVRFYEKQIVRMNKLYADIEAVNEKFLKLRKENYGPDEMLGIVKNWLEYVSSFGKCWNYLIEDKSDINQYEKIDKEKIKMRKLKKWFNDLAK